MAASPWQIHLAYYQQQQKLEQYQQQRILPKPKTTRFTVALHATFLNIAVLCAVLLPVFTSLEIWIKLTLSIFCTIGILELYGRFLCIKIVECYQHYAPETVRRKCKCVPSCSEYAILCLKKYELVHGLLKIRKRLFVTCKGFDYIIDNPTKEKYEF